MNEFITVKYSCKGCNKINSLVVVKSREDQDVVEYVLYVRTIVANDHSLNSPICQCEEVDLSIPISKDGVVGIYNEE